jgi:glycosyltransferase involved in cell wall biosynthesis
MSQPVISVITVVYNGVATLEKTLQSVFRQTWPHIDYVLVDGGSTDGTLQVIDRYRLRLGAFVSEPDKGIYDAMNKGIRLAKGDYVFFLGSDDFLHDEKVFAGIFGDAQNLQFDLIYGNVISPSYKGWYDGPFTFPKLLNRNISHQAIFYKRAVFQRTGDYDLRYRIHADWDLNIRWFKEAAIEPRYVNVLVAEFGAEGVSAGHDVLFIREVLIRENLSWLALQGGLRRSLAVYDEWWRLLRNAGIRDQDALLVSAGKEKIPPAVKRMLNWQKKLPPRLLRIGPISKLLVFINYISNF